LSVLGDHTSYDVNQAEIEAKKCEKLLSQVQYHVAQARKMDNNERDIFRKQKKEQELYRAKQIEDRTKALQKRDEQRKELLLKRQEYREKTKKMLVFDNVLENGKGKRRENYGSDSGGNITSVLGGNRSPGPSKSNKPRKG